MSMALAPSSPSYAGRVKMLTVRLDDDLHAAVMAKAEKKSTNVSALVRKSLQRWVDADDRPSRLPS